MPALVALLVDAFEFGILGVVHVLDAVGVSLLVVAGTAIFLGQAALARADDFAALYWLAIGIAGLAAAVQIARPGKDQA